MVAKLLPLVPLHKRYIKVFGGGAALLWAKPPVEVEVYNDLDGGLVHFFRVLQDFEQFEMLYHRLQYTLYSRQEFNDVRATWEAEIDPVIRAHKWYIVARMSFSGHFGNSWSSSVTTSVRGMAKTTSSWLSAIESLPRFHKRVQRVQVEQADFRDILNRYDTAETFFYLDPPYVSSTRSAGGYKHEITDKDHRDLIEIILNLQGKVLLSGYPNPIYNQLIENGWHYKEWQTICHAARVKQPRVEAVWANYDLTNP